MKLLTPQLSQLLWADPQLLPAAAEAVAEDGMGREAEEEFHLRPSY